VTMTTKILHWLCRLILAGVFVYSGYVKLREPLQFAVAISGYKLVPENLIFPMAKYLPWMEIILGLAVLAGWKIRYFSAATAALLFFFIAVLAITISRGIEANCGCFGLDEKISPLTILRDSLFLIPALYLTFEAQVKRRWGKTAPSA
jgi:uncharacterized membrane protein YphA (DoxX/SURF4 family)